MFLSLISSTLTRVDISMYSCVCFILEGNGPRCCVSAGSLGRAEVSVSSRCLLVLEEFLLLLFYLSRITNLKWKRLLWMKYLEVTFGLVTPTVPCVPFMNWPQGGEIVLTQRVWNNSGGGGWTKKLEQWEKRSSWKLGWTGSLEGARDRVSHTPHWRRNETIVETETVARATTKAGREK